MKIGIISDTHGLFDDRIPELFSDVDHILHAGDIGDAEILARLCQIAPLTAVAGKSTAMAFTAVVSPRQAS